MPPRLYDPEVDVIALSFATRLLLTDLNRDLIIERAVESLADFGRSDRIGLFLLDEDGEHLIGHGGRVTEGVRLAPLQIPLSGTPCEEVIEARNARPFGCALREDLPWPARDSTAHERTCLCAPLIAANNKVIGVANFEHESGYTFEPILMQSLNVLLTVVAIALETARLFEHAVYDGLTGLYVRRYFDLRLQEEVNRIKRYGGKLALLITDIDHFKSFNDRYGHQQGDVVLQETAGIMMTSVRMKLDAVCRYGGEEFVVIMPDTDLKGAGLVAERIRAQCERHPFPGPDGGQLHVTLSGGVAAMDQEGFLSARELLQQADACLYQAKRAGRNRITVHAGPKP